MKRETVGKMSSDLKKGESDNTHSATEQMREQLSDFEENMEACVRAGKSEHPRDFYVVVITKKERLMDNVIRNYFLNRRTCPTPDWDQAVYKYWHKDEHLDFLWVVPSKDTCQFITDNALTLPDEQKDLLKFVMDFNDGTLLNRAKILNGEIVGTNIKNQ